jgi:hypothetical protein
MVLTKDRKATFGIAPNDNQIISNRGLHLSRFYLTPSLGQLSVAGNVPFDISSSCGGHTISELLGWRLP